MYPRSQKHVLSICIALVVVWASISGAAAEPQSGQTGQTSRAPTVDRNAPTKELIAGARQMFVAEDFRQAETLYQTVLVREPDNVTAILELAVVYEKTGRLQYAQGLLARALVIRPTEREIISRNQEIAAKLAQALRSEINSLLATGAYEAAIPKLAMLLTTQPENAYLYYKKAECHLKLGNPEAALKDIDRALDLRREDRFMELKTGIQAAMAQAVIEPARPAQISARTSSSKPVTNGKATSDGPDPKAGSTADTDGGWVERFASSMWGIVKRHAAVLITISLMLLLLGSPLTRVLVRALFSQPSLSGRLDHFSIQEILSLLNTHQRTGALSLDTAFGKGRIYFKKGEIYHCDRQGSGGRKSLQRLLKDAREGSFTFKEGTVSNEQTIEAALGLILLELPERAKAVTSRSILKKQQSKMKTLLEK